MTTDVIVQARLGSTRLPGKVLMPLAGRSVLAWVLERCGAIPGIDGVCCAIPEGVDDEDVAREARLCGVPVFRGSELQPGVNLDSNAALLDLMEEPG